METNVPGIKELHFSEMRNINGGIVLLASLAVIARVATMVGVAIYVYNNAPDFVEGFKEGYQSTQN